MSEIDTSGNQTSQGQNILVPLHYYYQVLQMLMILRNLSKKSLAIIKFIRDGINSGLLRVWTKLCAFDSILGQILN